MRNLTFITTSIILSIFAVSYASDQVKSSDNKDLGGFNKAHAIIDKKCTTCHTKEKIDIALSSGKEMNSIQREMERKGAHLSAKEQEVLGIFWKESKPVLKR